LKIEYVYNIFKDLLISFTKFWCLKKLYLEIFNIFENDIINVKANKVLWYFKLNRSGHYDWNDLSSNTHCTTTKCGCSSLVHVQRTSEFTTSQLGPFSGTNEFIQNAMKSFGIQGCILL
jgi:hypothetical protein